ncbi:MAG: precorrin-6A reductase [Clostridium sp.]
MKFLVFAGTTEGRMVVEYLLNGNAEVTACVATEYGSDMLIEHENLKINVGRLDMEAMKPLIREHDFVVDATHPYAEVVTSNIKEACHAVNTKYIRIKRSSLKFENVIEVEDTEKAVQLLKNTSGNVLVTTGSKELHKYIEVPGYKERLFPRVLPTVAVMEKCSELGFEGSNLICMQGPFSFEMNCAMLKQFNISYMVTKDTGTAGGFEEKVKAAKKNGVKIVLIKRPVEAVDEADSFDIESLKTYLTDSYGSVQVHNDTKTDNICRDLSKQEHVKHCKESKFFPLFIDIKDKNILVVGGGTIATRRVNTLIKVGARIKVVAPQVSEELRELEARNLIEVISRNYISKDIDGCFLVVAATNDREVNCLVGGDAKEAGAFISVADCKEENNFYFPAVFEAEGIVGGLVSKGGANHSLVRKTAVKIRKCLQGEEMIQNEKKD